ncbi:MAG: tripartite tricarboxylate transporter TctB family protein [Hyphomicrobiaceae bacterium]
MIRIRNPQDFAAGLLFIGIGALGLYLARDLTYGSASNMGPGFFPTWLSATLLGLGVIVTARSFVLQGFGIGETKLRPLFFVLLAVLAGGYLIDRIGLALSLIILVFIASMSRSDTRYAEVAVIAVFLAIGCVVVFVHLLGQSLPGWWGR